MQLSPQFDHVAEYEGTVGNANHITRTERGMMPIEHVARMQGARGEQPGDHGANKKSGARWDSFKSAYASGEITSPMFITVDHGKEPVISEGNSRRDAAVELGHTHVPYEASYYGHAERQGLIHER
jgi:hypothetical protein